MTEFFYDITAIKTGKTGKYILQPQISESSPDKGFEEVN